MRGERILENSALISIIIPAYNVKPYIGDCVDSVLNQKYDNFEIIIIDDGSTDGTGEFCDELCKTDSRIRVIHKKNEGPSAARNVGVQSAKGSYISFVDSDDKVSPDYLRVLYENAVKFNADVSQCGFVRFENEDEIVPNTKNTPVKRDKEYLYDLLAEIGPECKSMGLIVVWNKLIRREIVEKISFPEGRWHEDEFYVNYLMENTNVYIESPAQLYYYRKRANSIVGENNRDNRRHLDLIAAFRERTALYKRVCDKKLYKKVKAAYHETIKIQIKVFIKFNLLRIN